MRTGIETAVQCRHLDAITEPPSPHTLAGCEECLKIGSSWVHLRLCLVCGHVGCCDSSPHRHASKHFHHANHAVIASFEPGEQWGWCYVHQEMLELPERFLPVLRI